MSRAGAKVVLAENLAQVHPADHPWDVYAVLRTWQELTTKAGDPYANLELADLSGVRRGRIWSRANEAFAALRELAPDTPVKLRCQVESFKNQIQLNVEQLREVAAKDAQEGYDKSALFDPALDLVGDLVCKTLVIDIETVPAFERRELPTTVAETLARFADRREMEASTVMSLSPFFGKAISLAVGDGDADPDAQEVTVLAVPPTPDSRERRVHVGNAGERTEIRFVEEADLLRAFWALAGRAKVVVTYNGRNFDIPFLMGRSLVREIPARVDLLSNRYSLQPHLDLLDLLGQHGRSPATLDVVCWSLGIQSPKGHMDGSMVAPAYAKGEIEEIAIYNANDVRATTRVYQRVAKAILRFRQDWEY